MAKNDREIIYQAYKAYIDSYTQRSMLKAKMAKMLFRVQMDLLNSISLKIGNEIFELDEKKNIIKDVKNIYVEYCRCIKSNPVCANDEDRLLMDKVLYIIAGYELEIFNEYRKRLQFGNKFDIGKLLMIFEFNTQIVQRPLEKIVNQYLSNIKLDNEYSEEYVYITTTGSKYHMNKCRYVNSLNENNRVIFKLANNFGLEPCKCILDYRKRIDESREYMTVFIDESIRKSPWSNMHDDADSSQGVFSYIICQGKLRSENEITQENTVASSSGLLEEKVNTTNAAIETINNVLMKLAFIYEFDKDVIIYTDNISASKSWEKNEKNKYLMNLFDSVSVFFIHREQNTIADKIGRAISYFDVPTSIMEKIVYKCKVYDELAEKIMSENVLVK